MKRILVVVLCLALAAAGFVGGYLARDHLTRPTAPALPLPTQPAAGGPAAKAESGAANEPRFEIDEDSIYSISQSPLFALMGGPHETFSIDEHGDMVRNEKIPLYLARYEHGPAWVHVEYFVDFVQDGVKKRAFFQAFNLGGDDSPRMGRDPGPTADGRCDLSKSRGAVTLDGDMGLRTVREYSWSVPKGNDESALLPSWDVFESYTTQKGAEPPPALVLDFDQCEKSGKKGPCSPPYFHDPEEFGRRVAALGGGPDADFRTGYFTIRGKANYAGRDGVAVLSIEILSMPNKIAATEETAAADADQLRKEADDKPDDAEVKWRLARAVDHQRAFLKERTPETEYPLAEEAATILREATKQEPGDVFYRAEQRKLLFRQASLMTEGKRAAEFPKVLEEIESLVPLYDQEYTDAAAVLAAWKNPELDKGLPDGEKKHITQETDAHIVKLLRRHAEIWQKRPEEIKTKRDHYESQAKGKSYADSPEFKSLLEEMQGWAKVKD